MDFAGGLCFLMLFALSRGLSTETVLSCFLTKRW